MNKKFSVLIKNKINKFNKIISVENDKSISHRALLIASQCVGPSVLKGVLEDKIKVIYNPVETNEDIEKILWPNNDGVNKSAMRLHIHRLREKTNTITNHIDFIKTVRGKGIFIDSSLF